MARYQFTVNGKRVILREHLPAKEYLHIIGGLDKIANLGDLPYDEQVKEIKDVVEEWEFEGDPADIESWGTLNAPVFAAIVVQVTQYIGRQVEVEIEEAKN